MDINPWAEYEEELKLCFAAVRRCIAYTFLTAAWVEIASDRSKAALKEIRNELSKVSNM